MYTSDSILAMPAEEQIDLWNKVMPRERRIFAVRYYGDLFCWYVGGDQCEVGDADCASLCVIKKNITELVEVTSK